MIQKIIIKETSGCFDNIGIEIDGLKKVNYFYGSNGSGKTTISRVIGNCEEYPTCRLLWENNREFETMVYNRDFVDENFHQSEEIKGIFTLGKDSREIQESISKKYEEINKIEEKLDGLNKNLEQKINEKEKHENIYEEQCWELKLKYDKDFKEAFTGARGSKSQFKSRCLHEATNNAELKTYEDLKLSYDIVFGDKKEEKVKINEINYDGLDEILLNPILSMKVIGSEDVNISELIQVLNNSDWVQQGYEYYKSTDGICPFCQCRVDEGLEEELEKYFDETYNSKIREINAVEKEYELLMHSIMKQINNIINSNNEFLNMELLELQKSKIESKNERNIKLLENKIGQPILCVELQSFSEEIQSINDAIGTANKSIDDFNTKIKNIKEEREKLTAEIWRFISEENKVDYKNYNKKLEDINNAIDGINTGIESKNNNRISLTEEIQELEGKITSVSHTVNEINKILTSFGFLNFNLTEAEKHGNYKLVRENGEDAKDTLSEGEKSFITFLYFYHLLKGSNDKENIMVDRIVVFDDPISSLDSSILFIVSNLIREIIGEVQRNDGNIKQVFIFTHNVYFHKEVSFDTKRGAKDKMKDETFWILRKEGINTRIKNYDSNPIKTSYELLWEELKNYSEHRVITVQNTMRRIIENYFKILGGLNDNDLVGKFEPEEQIICNALLSWLNDGSHFVNDDLYVDTNSEIVDQYFEVFRKIFIVTGNEGHYNMMMGLD